MINVSFTRGKNGKIVKVKAKGHSGLSEHGSDILCAAVSALVQTAYLALLEKGFCKTYKKDVDTGTFEFDIIDADDRHDADVILRALAVGLEDLHSGYPQNLKTEVN